MDPNSPEKIIIQRRITLINGLLTESAKYSSEITVTADNLGANHWAEMIARTQSEGREVGRSVFFDPLSKKFVEGPEVLGEEGKVSGEDGLSEFKSPFGGIRKFLFTPIHVASLHTHPLIGKDGKPVETNAPSGNDLRVFLSNAFPAMVVIHRDGAHLLIRLSEQIKEDPTAKKVVQKASDEIFNKDGTMKDLRRVIGELLGKYGVGYYYSENIVPSNDNRITFKRTSSNIVY